MRLTRRRLRKIILEEVQMYLYEQDTESSDEYEGAMDQRIEDMKTDVATGDPIEIEGAKARATAILEPEDEDEIPLTDTQKAELESIRNA
jgi:hypothetical protein